MNPIVALDPRVDGMAVSATLAARSRSGELAAAGATVFRLGLGQSPFPVPAPVVVALRAAAAEKDYLAPGGLPELREQVAEFHRRRHGLAFAADDVVIGPGSKHLMYLLQLCWSGDVLVPTPSWASNLPQGRLAGRRVVRLPPGGARELLTTPEAVAAACAADPVRPRLLLFNSPSNPTGLVYEERELAALAQVCRDHGIVVLSDEIYADLGFALPHRSIASHYPEGTIVMSGLSKWCGAGGWRLGTMAFPATLRSLRHAVEAVASETCSSTAAPIQRAAIAAFRGTDEVEAYLADVRRILAGMMFWAFTELSAIGLEVPEPRAAFYLFPSLAPLRDALARRDIVTDVDLVRWLRIETGIVALPGRAFGMPPEALRVRLALVDFDGARALVAADQEPISARFVARHLTPVHNAIARLTAWCTIQRGRG